MNDYFDTFSPDSIDLPHSACFMDEITFLCPMVKYGMQINALQRGF